MINGEAQTSNVMQFPLELSKITNGRGTYSSFVSKYGVSNEQNTSMEFTEKGLRCETIFIINDMKVSKEPLDKTLTSKKKDSRHKFTRQKKGNMD